MPAGLVVPTDVTLPLTDAETPERMLVRIRDSAGDIEIVDETSSRLGAERAGNGDGRVQTITYSASDRARNALWPQAGSVSRTAAADD